MGWTGFQGQPSKDARLDGGEVIRIWKCVTPSCDNAVCMWASESRCFPCCEAEVGHDEMVRRFNATHTVTWDDLRS